MVERAWQVLETLESESRGPQATAGQPPVQTPESQLSFFGSGLTRVEIRTEVKKEFLPHPTLEALQTAAINEMTPLQALNFLAELQKSAKDRP